MVRWSGGFGRMITINERFHDASRSQSSHIVTTKAIHWLCFLDQLDCPSLAKIQAPAFP